MKIILLLTENSEITDNISDFRPQNLDLVVIRNEKFLTHYLEEYLPDYVIVNMLLKDVAELGKYAINYPDSAIFFTCQLDIASEKYPNFIFTENESFKKNIKEIIDAVSEMENKRKKGNDKIFKLVNQQVVSVVSFKGGTGKTTFAYNLAYFLKKQFESKVLLLDLNLSGLASDLSSCLKIKQIPSMGYFIENKEEGEDAFKNSIIPGGNNAIDVLLPPMSDRQVNKLDADLINKLISLMKSLYNFIIIDFPVNFNSITREAALLSDSIVIISAPIRSCAVKLSGFNFKNNFKAQNVISILNNPYDDFSINKGDFSDISGYPVLFDISNVKDKEKKYLDYAGKNTEFLNLQPEIKQLAEKYLII